MSKSIFSIVVFVLFAMPLHADETTQGADLLRADIDDNRTSIETNSKRISENRESIAIVATVVDETQQYLVNFSLEIVRGIEDTTTKHTQHLSLIHI